MFNGCRYCLVLLCLMATIPEGRGQKQLVLLKGEKVKLRLYPGDELVYRLKSSSTVVKSYVNNLFDTAVVAHRTVVPYHRIERVYFDQARFQNVVGGLLVTAGIGYFVIDQFNVVVVQGDKANLNDNVTISSLVLTGIGLPLMILRKKSQKIGGRYRLLTVDRGSVFYQPDRRHDPAYPGTN